MVDGDTKIYLITHDLVPFQKGYPMSRKSCRDQQILYVDIEHWLAWSTMCTGNLGVPINYRGFLYLFPFNKNLTTALDA